MVCEGYGFGWSSNNNAFTRPELFARGDHEADAIWTSG